MTETFIDAESEFHSNEDDIYNIKRITFEQFRDCLKKGSVEFKGGYWEDRKSTNKQGISTNVRVYVPDTREEYCNSIDSLYDCLLPKFDDEMKKVAEEINASLKELRDECLRRTELEDKQILSSEFYEGNDKRIIEEYKFAKRQLYRQLFQELSLLFNRMGYLSSATYHDGMVGVYDGDS